MQDKVKDQINEWTDDKIMFTAYDVTVALRNGGERVKHSDIKTIVHDLYVQGEMDTGYSRQMVNVPGTNAQAFLYLHVISDPDEYEPIKATYQKNSPIASRPNAGIPSVSSVKSTTVNRVGDRNRQPINDTLDPAYPKYDGRLTIPRVLIKKAGLFQRNYRVIEENGATRLTHPSASNDGEILNPKSDGTIEVPRKHLKHLNNATYKISLKGDDIYVK